MFVGNNLAGRRTMFSDKKKISVQGISRINIYARLFPSSAVCQANADAQAVVKPLTVWCRPI